MPEDSPIGKDITPRAKKDIARKRLPSRKKDSAEFFEASRQISAITPQTDPQEAVRRIKRMSDYIDSKNDPVLPSIFDEILRRSGRNPSEWVRYSSLLQPKDLDKGFTKEDMDKLTRPFPDALEFFVTQGSPKKYYDEHSTVEKNVAQMVDHLWVGFVRVRPETQQIEGNT